MKTFLPYSLLYIFFFFCSNISIANNDEFIKSNTTTSLKNTNVVTLDNAGNLIYTDDIGVNDDISIVLEGTNYRLSNTAVALTAANKVKQDGDAVLVPITLVTGKIIINTKGGDDTFTVNLSNGNIRNIINYNGGTQSTTTGDDMVLIDSNNRSYDTVTHTFINDNDGFVDITNNNRINYKELEPITDNLNTTNRVFTFTGNTGSTELITLEAGGTLNNRINSDAGESVDFNNPSNSVTINLTGSGDDILEVRSFSPISNASLTVNSDGVDEIRFPNNSINFGGGSLNLTAHNIHFLKSVTATSITTTSTNTTTIESATIRAVGGSLTMTAGTVVPVVDGVNTDTGGLHINLSQLQTVGTQDINLTGTTYAARNIIGQPALNGLSMENSSIVTEFGDVTITGSGVDNGLADFSGVHLGNNTSIQSLAGYFTINGTGRNTASNANIGVSMVSGNMRTNTSGSVDITGVGYLGIDIGGSLAAVGSGSVLLQGTSAVTTVPAINISSTSARFTANNTINLTVNTGYINTPSGVATHSHFNTNNTFINGKLAPGQSPGQLFINSHLVMDAADGLEMEVDDFTNFGTDYDQLKVNGNVNLNNAAFNLVDQSGNFPLEVTTLTIIDNVGTNPVVGTFNGLPQGATIIGNNGKIWRIFYNQGDGNDVVLSSGLANPNVVVAEGNMTFTGIASENDNLTITIDGANYRLSDSGKQVVAGMGTIQDGNDVLVAITSVTGTIHINTGDGNDSLNVNLDGGVFTKDINFDGGNGTDGIVLSGSGTFNNVTHTINNTGEGTIAITGNNAITYTGLEGTITDNFDVNDRVFTINSSNAIQFEPTGSLGNQVAIDGSLTIDYNNPNNTLTVNGAGASQGFVVMNGFATGFTADVTVNRLEDVFRFGFNSNNTVDFGTGNLNVLSKVVLVRTNIATEGSITLTSLETAYIAEGDIISSAGENITIHGGTQPTNSAFSGLEIFESTIQTSGAGTITLRGDAFLDNTVASARGMTLFETNVLTDTGDISITGIGPTTGNAFSGGINMSIATNIQSNAGNINIVGTAGNSIGNLNKGIIMYDGANIQTMGAGTITIEGTGGTGVDTNYGIEMQVNSVIRTENGNIAITGTSTDASGADQIGILIDGTIDTTGTGNISIIGTSGTANDPAINMAAATAQIQSGGTITMTANLGEINTPNGVTSQTQLDATNTIINGKLAPGQSPGQLIVNGNLTMASDDALEIDVNDFNNAVTDYDQVIVNGTVDLSGATLNLADTSGSFSGPENLILINNDGTDPIVGTFNGLPNGALIAGNGKNWYIYYNLASTNDVLLSSSPPNIQVDGSGNLVFSDPYSINDNLTIIIEGANYRISDSVKPIVAGPGVIQDGNEVLIAIASVTGTVNINTGDGDDSLKIDFDGGNFTNSINYDGGSQNNKLSLLGNTTYNNVTHTFTGTNEGSINITGNNLITYDEVNQAITDNLQVNDKAFALDLDDYITLKVAGTLDNQIDVFESTTLDYKNPINSLTISNIGLGNNTIVIQGFATGFDTDVTINATEDDDVRFDTNATNLGNGNLNVNSGKLTVDTNGSIITTGSISTSTKSTTTITGTIQSNGNNISITAGTEIVSGSNSGGIYMFNGLVEATGAGNIILDGTIYLNISSSTTIDGVRMRENSRVITDTGSITITGKGIDNGLANFRGIRIEDTSMIQSNSGDISVTGTSNIVNISAMNLTSSSMQIQTSGNLALTANTGGINTPSGVNAQTQFNANNTTINGILAPGQSPGQLNINGNFAIGTGDTLEMEVNNFTTAGSDYDQIVVNGTVNLTDAMLNVTDTSSPFNANIETLILIANDGTDPVIGTFAGLPNGSAITGNEKTWIILYNEGDGNDVVLRSGPISNIIVDESGNLIFSNSIAENDNLTIIVDGANYRISDSGKPLLAGAGTIQDGNDVLVSIATVTGVININTGDGDDLLNINFDGGNIIPEINYDGGNQVDRISLSGTNTHNSVAHTITGNKVGSVNISDNGIINYTGLEHTISDYLNVNDRIFTFNIQVLRIILEEASGGNHQIFALNGTRVEFKNPLNSLTVDGEFELPNGSFATSFVDVESMGTGLDTDLIINRAHDNVRFMGANSTDLGSGNLNVTSKSLDLFHHNITTAGSITTTSEAATSIRNSTIQSNGGSISITSGTSVIPNSIVELIMDAGHLQTMGGAINLNGTAYVINGFSTPVHGLIMKQSSTITTDSGNITITGNGVDGGSINFRGVRLEDTSSIQSNTGNIIVNGTGRNTANTANIGVSMLSGTTIQTAGEGTVNITGTGWKGIEVDGMVSTTGTGNVWLNGTSGNVDIAAINLPSSNAKLEVGGFLYLTTNVGAINTPNGITSEIQFDAHTGINGVLAPGQSPGQLTMTGNLAIGSGDTLELEVTNFTTAGSDYDQVVVNGIVNINGAALTLIDNSGVLSNAETLTLIENDSSDPIIGTFNGLPSGASIAGNNKTWYIYYNQGDGNDVVLSSEIIPNVIVDGAGNLVFSDPYLANDNLTLSVDGLNYRISDSGKLLIAGSGTTQDGNDVLIPIASVTGVININTGAGNDNFNVNFDGGNFVNAINLNGGNQPDTISLLGTTTHTNVNYTFSSIDGGSINVANNSSITYTKLANTIIDNLIANDRVFTFGINNHVIMETSNVLDNHIAVLGGTGIRLHYKNPLNSLTFNDSGLVNSSIDVKGLASGFDADFSVNKENSRVNFRIIPTDIGSGNLNVIADQLKISKEITTTGSITTSSKNETAITDATVQSNGGNISMTAGTDAASIGQSTIEMNNGHIQTSGSGSITLNGNAFIHYMTNNTLYGVEMKDGSSIGNETGNITITGNGIDNGNADYGGVFIEESSTIQSTTGNVFIEGTSNNIDISAINILSTDVQVQTGGDITVTANVGVINTPSGVNAQTQFNANNITINGILAPGQSPGQLILNGNLAMESDDTLEIEVTNFTVAGSDYDQVVVNGTVSINGTSLTLKDSSGAFSEDPETLIVINNDGTDPVIGTFNNLPNGAAIAGNGKTWYIYYNEGDGNDVILSSDIIGALSMRPKVYLQGAILNPNTGEEMLMRDDLRVAGMIPTTSPYSDNLTVNATVFNITGVDAIVDWIWVELRSATNSTQVVASQSALLQRDGDIVAIDGVSPVSFVIPTNNYYVVIKHRNHLSIMSSTAIALSNSDRLIDFTNGSTSTYGSNAQTTFGTPSGKVAMWAGNVNGDVIVQYSGVSPDSPSILSTILNDPGNFLNFPTYAVSGYNVHDINMDGNTQYTGTTPDTPLLLENVLAHPGNFLNFSTYQIQEQLPED